MRIFLMLKLLIMKKLKRTNKIYIFLPIEKYRTQNWLFFSCEGLSNMVKYYIEFILLHYGQLEYSHSLVGTWGYFPIILFNKKKNDFDTFIPMERCDAIIRLLKYCLPS